MQLSPQRAGVNRVGTISEYSVEQRKQISPQQPLLLGKSRRRQIIVRVISPFAPQPSCELQCGNERFDCLVSGGSNEDCNEAHTECLIDKCFFDQGLEPTPSPERFEVPENFEV
jgi:hypothetical protein